MKFTKIFKAGLIAIFVLGAFCVCEPAIKEYAGNVRLFEDGDNMQGTGDSYFAISPNGTLVGWGSNRLNRIGGMLHWRPYIARKCITTDVNAFSCGSTAAMYVDSENVLWGWGTNTELLFADEAVTPNRKVQVMEDVRDVAVGFQHAAVIKTDGSLWIWGRQIPSFNSDAGENIVSLDGAKRYSPERIMEQMEKVYVIEEVTFAISESDELYIIEVNEGYKPRLVAQQVKSVAYLGDNTLYQYLTSNGDVFVIDIISNIKQESRLLENDVRSICSGGLIKKDSSLWVWVNEEDGSGLKEESDNVLDAVDKDYYLTNSGTVFLRMEALPGIYHFACTIVPVLQNSMIICAATYMWLLKRCNVRK